jgi:spore germination protein YaaH
MSLHARRAALAPFILVLAALASALSMWGAGAAASPAYSTTQALQAAQAPHAPLAAAGGIGVRWGFYITYNSNSLDSLRSNARYLNYVSPWYFNLTADGRITGSDQAAASNIIKNAGAKSLPMLKNSSAEYDTFSAILSDTVKVNGIVDQIDAIVQANNYDGITIDFEAVNPQDKTRLTILMSRIYDRLHPKGKLVAMAVAPKVKDISTGWAAAYDYPALGRTVDYVIIMAYDYAWSNGDPGPIAPVAKLRDTAAYTLARIPANQVIWGVGVYGYDWARDEQGKSLGQAEYRTWAEANAIANQPGAQKGYDTTAQAPWVRYMRGTQQREMWYEDSRSFQVKLEVIMNRNIAGFAIWRLGQEDPAIWPMIAAVPTPVPVTPSPVIFPVGGGGTAYVPPVAATATTVPTSTPRPPTSTPTPTPKPVACKPITAFKSTADKLYFPETGHSLGGTFLKYWQKNGGLPVYGYPLTEEFQEKSPTDGKTYRVQYFERNRFEYHPENQPPNDVQLGLLGVQALGMRLFPPAVSPETGADTVYFPQVQHTISGAFLKYWQKKGGIGQFGYPVTEPLLEKSSIDGKAYTVQYMERARFELHPEYAGGDAEVLLGLLGLDISPCR